MRGNAPPAGPLWREKNPPGSVASGIGFKAGGRARVSCNAHLRMVRWIGSSQRPMACLYNASRNTPVFEPNDRKRWQARGLFPSGGSRRRRRGLLLATGFLCALLSLFLLVIFGICIAHNHYYSVIGSGDARKNRELLVNLADHRIIDPCESIRTHISRLHLLLSLRLLNRNPLCRGLHIRFVLPLRLRSHNYTVTGTIAGTTRGSEASEARPL